jgi:hypothetical protein
MKRLLSLIVLAVCVLQVFGQDRLPLIEEFSSSTCPPCKTFNDGVFNPFLNTASYQGKYTVVNYRADWPGNGDPYYTAEAGTRIKSDSITGVPTIFIDGKIPNRSSLSSFTASFDYAASLAPKVSITASYQITGTTVATGKVKATVTVTPTAAISNTNLYIAVVEKLTTKNASTNGEKEFHYVMMKMVPNASGKALTLTANTPITIIDSALLSGTHIEEMSDLAVVCWVQFSGIRGEVLQSAFGTEGLSPVINRCLLNGCSSDKSLTMIRNNSVYNAKNTQIAIHDLSGREIAKVRSTAETFTPTVFRLPRGCYILKVGTGKQALTELISITR